MSRKKKNIQKTNRIDRAVEQDISPFAGIVLKEKAPDSEKTIKVQPKAKSVKKPSDIVQGYNPAMSFADILYSFEKTGNPYSMPKPKAGKTENKAEKEDFGSILAKWEGKGKSKVQKRCESVKNEYKPTKSFADILSSFESSSAKNEPDGKKSVPSKSKDAKQAVSNMLREEDDDNKLAQNASWSIIGGKNTSFVRQEKSVQDASEKKEKRASKQYKPNVDFSLILDEFETKAEKKQKDVAPVVKVDEESKKEVVKQADIPISEHSFFRQEDEDNRKAENVSWSIIGGKNMDFVRPDESQESLEEKDSIKKQEYCPEVPFGEILSSFEKKSLPKTEKATMKEAVKTFEEILKEKGDSSQSKPKITITKLRTMMPQATLDLHGETQQDSQKLVADFLSECKENGLRKICIITGKGLHSDGGEGVIRPLVERMLDESGIVSEKNNAPFYAGGSGALWIILKA